MLDDAMAFDRASTETSAAVSLTSENVTMKCLVGPSAVVSETWPTWP